MDELFFEIIHPNHPYYKTRTIWLKAQFDIYIDKRNRTDKKSLAERLFIHSVLEDYQKWKTTDQP